MVERFSGLKNPPMSFPPRKEFSKKLINWIPACFSLLQPASCFCKNDEYHPRNEHVIPGKTGIQKILSS